MTSAHPDDGGPLDAVLRAALTLAVDGRVYPLFAFLFGYGMVQLARSRVGRGWTPEAIRRTLKRRHLFLLLFGFGHALLLFGGDILGAYGLAGLVLVAIFFNLRERTILVWAVVFIGLTASSGLLTILSAVGLWWFVTASPEAGNLGSEDFSDAMAQAPFGSLADVMAGQANYLFSALIRVGLWLVSTPGVVLGLTVPGMILLGWLAARRGILEHPAAHRTLLTRVAVAGIAVGWLSAVPSALQQLGVLALPAIVDWAPMSVSYAFGAFAGLGYAALFGLLATRGREQSPAGRAVAALGQRSLSGYLWQSIIMAPLLSAWGFGVGARVTTAGVLAIALGVWVASVLLAAWLERTGRPGPFEWLLRRLIGRPDAGAAPRPGS